MRLWPKRFATDEQTNLGRVLTLMGVISASELAEALERQKGGEKLKLGEILLEFKVISEDALKHALRLQAMMRNGSAAEAMLQISEHRTEKEHRRISSTFNLKEALAKEG